MRYTVKSGLVLVGVVVAGVLAGRGQERVTPFVVSPPGVVRPLLAPERLMPAQASTQTLVNFLTVIPIPGNPFASGDISWVDQQRGRAYLADRSNFGVDIFDMVNSVFVGRVTGMVGPVGSNGAGPNGVLVTEDNKLWAGDGNSTLQVADLNVDPPVIIKSIATGGAGDGRADELGYDPLERVILVANNAAKPPFLTFVSADTYAVLGKIPFPDASGLEQPVWNPQLHRFFVTVPAGANSYIAAIDPTGMTVTKRYPLTGCGATGLVLGPFQRLMVSCGFPIIMNAIDGHTLATITQVHGGDEIWFNNGDGRLYVTSTDLAGVTVLGVIDVESGTWLQNVPVARGRNPSAYEQNNHIFVPVSAPPAGTPDVTVCAAFGLKGCIAIFTHN
jgi:hypothetical protein